MLKKYELNLNQMKELKNFSSKRKSGFLVSAFDEECLLDLKKN